MHKTYNLYIPGLSNHLKKTGSKSKSGAVFINFSIIELSPIKKFDQKLYRTQYEKKTTISLKHFTMCLFMCVFGGGVDDVVVVVVVVVVVIVVSLFLLFVCFLSEIDDAYQ